jgi:hypothetical protein
MVARPPIFSSSIWAIIAIFSFLDRGTLQTRRAGREIRSRASTADPGGAAMFAIGLHIFLVLLAQIDRRGCESALLEEAPSATYRRRTCSPTRRTPSITR